MRFVYADPPYIGMASYYAADPRSAVWDTPAAHHELMATLEADPAVDGWALSCASVNLAQLLPGAPAGTRVAAWVKPFCAYRRNVPVAYSWEPVLWHRKAPRRTDVDEPIGRDHLSCPMTMRRGFTGAKPEAFTRWLLVLLGAVAADEIVDLFIGSGAVTRELDRPRLF